MAVSALLLFRHVRNRPRRLQELFVRRAAKIPEVRVIVFQGTHFSVVVDRPVAQLYGRLNQKLSGCNRKIYMGHPFTLSILHEVSAEQLNKLLSGPGVQYVRTDVVPPAGPITQ